MSTIKGVDCIGKKSFILYLIFKEIRQEIIMIDAQDKKRRLIHSFESSKNHNFPKGLTHDFYQKFKVLRKIRPKIIMIDVLRNKTTSF